MPMRVTKAKSNSHDGKRPGGKSGNLLRTVTSRYDGIRGDRVVVNYDHFVSIYDSALDLCLSNFDSNSKRTLPRLTHLPADSLQPIRKRLTAIVLQHDVHTHTHTHTRGGLASYHRHDYPAIQPTSERSGLFPLYYNTITISGGCTNMGTIHRSRPP